MKNLILSISILSLLFACSSIGGDNDDLKTTKSGGNLTIPLDSYFTIERPRQILKIESAQIYGQVLESLVKFDDKTLEVQPALAEKWDISEDGLTYTFYL
jgi:ABC-type oligopeptide transport system substrate-binding subunit